MRFLAVILTRPGAHRAGGARPLACQQDRDGEGGLFRRATGLCRLVDRRPAAAARLPRQYRQCHRAQGRRAGFDALGRCCGADCAQPRHLHAFHPAGERRDRKLDRAAGQLGDAAPPVGIFACGQCRSHPACLWLHDACLAAIRPGTVGALCGFPCSTKEKRQWA
ncbi:hypothetical protein RPHASCH2410_CH19545 [Rhizobium phaseoli Ch24-10]|nr:hypothetical protein RPHASCH2410_CH19545 [Rhizobium phaseoli Ch24-10]